MTPPPFLGVEKSVTGRVWRDRLDERGAARALAIVQRHGTPELLARVLAGRGVEPDAVEAHLDPTIRRLMPDPDRLTDMAAAAARLADAVLRRERVTVFGDYDVDGATASALMTLVLRQCGLDPDIYIPDRIFEGYGPNVEAIRQIAARGTGLIVTVDCGTASHAPLAEAKRLGLDVVVVDHHLADETLPPAVALVNPNRQDDLSGLGHLAAVGLVFMTVVALVRELRRRGFWTDARPQPDLLAYVDLVALGTVADVVPLVGLNRAFVAKGLIGMRRRERPGLTALMDVARLSGPPEAWHLGFLLGPRINAGGRIGRADLGARLLTLDDPVEAGTIAAELDRLNRERQAIELAAVAEAEAEAMAALGHDEKGAVVVTAAAGWHPGVVGLVAARLKERFGRPAFAIALEPGDTGTGSGRSIPGVDLGRAVVRAVHEGLLVKGGGHAMAAGVTLKKTALAAFRAFLEEALAPAVELARRDQALKIDGAVSGAAVTPELCRTLAQAGPFGSGNPEPVLALPSHVVAYADAVGQAHVRLRLKAGDGAMVEAIAFRAAGQPLGRALLESRGQRVHVAGCLAVDRWQGAERAQLRVLDIAGADPTGLP
ncbi:Single-stranded-DNA-specific exonuclease RecJ [Rhodoplanes serenus]|uniref:Single-stranded-DNA-specific exonuclease RecJ n=1 Tax=Rhodoplanes serenus TaxID=200615 RepID=A0A447CVH1_9BRAD|nr:single-stranded-DNA-specific exonuclease RecJ [Rhodoplanes serenus]VCU09258.1 Single-stranded-DNA-specific exonuclease RecJ [Rhodoplanes serenus]